MNQILNQKPFKENPDLNANLYMSNFNEATTSIKILLTGFSGEGKSTFINLAFDKIVSYESRASNSITQNIREFFKPGPNDPNNNGVVIGGIKFIDVPGIIPGTNDNINSIKTLIKDSIKKSEESLDVINYILFFLKPGTIFTNNIDDFLKFLNYDVNIHVIFVINRVQISDPTKETLIDYLQRKRFNRLLENNGGNILEVDIINGKKEKRANEIYRYIHNDLINKNNFNIEDINQLQNDNELFTYLNQNSELYSNILSTEDFLRKSKRQSDGVIDFSATLITTAGFSPIPFVDIPIFLFIFAGMLISIFRTYGFRINKPIFNLFFRHYRVTINQNNQNNIEEDNENNDNNNQLVNNIN